MNDKPSYTSDTVEPTESAADYQRRLADSGHEGAQLAEYDEHLARRADEVRGLIRGTAVYLAELRNHPYRWDSCEYERYADYLDDLKDELAELEEQLG